jgi:DNA-directed RNA polymerase subunit K/omega
MAKEKEKPAVVDLYENKYLVVLTASKRARQLVSRAEKHGMAVDTEKVILQSLNEFREGKIAYEFPGGTSPKKKHKEKE